MPTTVTKSKLAKKTDLKPRVRMKPSERKELILAGAIDYFAEYGFTGKTRELSDRLGITQPLLYRYFPSKQVLMEEVFEIIFLDSWRTDWDALIRDESTPLIKRLTHFYQQYFAQLCIIWPILRFPYEFEFYWYFATWTDGTV